MFAASTARPGGTPGGHAGHRAQGDDIAILMRVETEDHLSGEAVRTLDHPADVAVAVLDGTGKLSLLERRPHRLIL